MAMNLSKTDKDGVRTVCVQGEVDLNTSPQLRTAITKEVPKDTQTVAVDLSGVSYMDSSGVATLVEGLRTANDRNAAFTLVTPSASVMKVLHLSRLDTVFDIENVG
ncbi:MAG: hypothetical protein AMXMBFR84_22140 [Candidatus Hydrogenedentota bacterium]